MKILHPWLADYIDGPLPDPESTARSLTFAGLEVESIDWFGRSTGGIVVARVETVGPHPNAAKLSVCEVFDGDSHRKVVCGAPNVRAGMCAPFAGPGTRLVNGMEVGEREFRGVVSSGMLLSAAEIGLWDDASGLLDLGGERKPGTPLRDLPGFSGAVLDVSATPNRPDALSHIGVAREVTALTGTRLRMPETDLEENAKQTTEVAKVRIEDPERCGRYVARVIEGVSIGPSPAWLRARLAAAGIRPIYNVVDVTNYVLLEMGHPLHAFDLDLLDSATIIVRRANPDETLVTLDDVERRLDREDLVIADASSPVALAGVMGGQTSEVSPKTERILLESAWFEPIGIRRSARRHGLHSESSHRFERGADPAIPLLAADRAASLISRLAGGVVLGGALDVHPRPVTPQNVTLRFDRTCDVLGLRIEPEDQERALVGLGFRVVDRAPDRLLLEVPSFRTEMSREIDLIEEVARLHGYDAIPSTLPGRSPESSRPDEAGREEEVVSRVREAASAAGCREVVNYSFLSESDVSMGLDMKTLPEARPLRLSNPLTTEHSVMRTTMLASLLGNLRYNRRFQRSDLKLYEVGRVYLAGQGDLIEEPNRLAAVFSGRRAPLSWTQEGAVVDFYDVKGLVETILRRLGVNLAECQFEIDENGLPWLHPRSACRVVGPSGERLGWLGEVHPGVAAHFELAPGVMAVELEVDALTTISHLVPSYKTIPRFPAVYRDLAVVVGEDVNAEQIRRLIEAPLPEAEHIGARVVDATLFDMYTGPQVGEGKRSLAYAIRYQATDRTLTDTETSRMHLAIVARLENELGAALRV